MNFNPFSRFKRKNKIVAKCTNCGEIYEPEDMRVHLMGECSKTNEKQDNI